MNLRRCAFFLFAGAMLFGPLPSVAALPANVQVKPFYDTTAIRFTEPVWFGQYPGKAGAFLVGELGGDLYLLAPVPGGFQKTLFGHVPAYKVSGNDGLLGIAFHPDFLKNRKYYVYYIPALGTGLLEERLAKASFGADSGTARLILQSSFGNTVHNGGDVHFGPDGYLYLGFGDAGNPNVYNARSQDLHVLPGKMIRIDINKQQGTRPYAIPADNPFASSPDTLVRKEIWAYGLRQPWRWNFDPLTGKMFVADVGDWVQEEVDTITKGGNYGWSTREGNTCFNSALEYSPLASCDTTGLLGPLVAITHVPVDQQGTGCIVGGPVYRGNPASGAYGAYLFGDYITHKLYAMLPVSPGVVQTSEIGVSPIGMGSFGTDSSGNVYMVGYDNGIIYRLQHADLTALARPTQMPKASIRLIQKSGLEWILDPSALQGVTRLLLVDMQGRTRITLERNELSLPFRLEPGLYLIQGTGPGVNVHSAVLLP